MIAAQGPALVTSSRGLAIWRCRRANGPSRAQPLLIPVQRAQRRLSSQARRAEAKLSRLISLQMGSLCSVGYSCLLPNAKRRSNGLQHRALA